MSEVHAATLAPDDRDWVSANWLVVRNRWLWRRLVATIAGLALFYAALLVAGDLADWGWSTEWALYRLLEGLAFSLLVTLVVLAMTRVLLPRRVRKARADVVRIAPETHFEFDTEGFRTRTAAGTTALAWTQLRRWLESARVIAIMITDRQMIIVPKAADPAMTDALRAALVAAGVPRR